MSTVPGTISRRTGINGPDNPGFQVSADEWNASLIIASDAPDGSLLVLDKSRPDGWGLAPEIPPVVGVPPTRTVNGHSLLTDVWVTQADVGLGNVENLKLSTWGGSAALATVGTITTGTWQGAILQAPYGGTGTPYAKFTGPTALHTYTLPNQDAILLTSVDTLPPAQGGTGVTTGLTQLNASNLATGIVPDARLAGNVGRTDVANNILWMAVNKAGSSLAALEVRSASDLNTGTLSVARLPPEVVLGPLTATSLPYHRTTHERNGADAIKLDDLALPDDNADLDATTTAHGLLPRLFGSPLLFLNSAGQWTPVSGGGTGGGSGDVIGPPSATPDAVPLFYDATGKVIKDSGVRLSQLARVDQNTTFSGTLTVAGQITAAGLDGTPLNASNLTTGTVPTASLPTIPPAQGGTGVTTGLTQLNASSLTSGSLPFARVPVSVASRLLGRGSSAAGAMEEILLAGGLTMTGTTLAVVGGTAGVGNVVGPASAVAGRIAVFADATGKLLADSGVASGNFAFLDQANVFTQNQTINKTAPQVQFWDQSNSNTCKAHVGQHVGANIALLSNNAMYGSGGWQADDTTKVGMMYLQADAQAAWYTITPGANPRPPVLLMSLDATALTLSVPKVLVNGTFPSVSLSHNGAVGRARVIQNSPGCAILSANVSTDGPNWYLDDTALFGSLFQVTQSGFSWYDFPAGANPSPPTIRASLAAGGMVLSVPLLVQTGSIRAQGARDPVAGGSTGPGVEVFTQSGNGYIHGYDITAANYIPMFYYGTSHNFQQPVNIAAGGLTVTGRISASQGMMPRIGQYGGTASIAPDPNQWDIISVFDLNQTLSIGVGNTGAATDGWPWLLRIRDNGTARALSWDGNYMSACGVPLPAATQVSRTLYLGFRWNYYYGRWQMIAVSQE